MMSNWRAEFTLNELLYIDGVLPATVIGRMRQLLDAGERSSLDTRRTAVSQTAVGLIDIDLNDVELIKLNANGRMGKSIRGAIRLEEGL